MKIVAKILLYDARGRILTLRRSGTHPRFPLHLDLPGGEVESGELPDESVVRELLEETGIQLSRQGIHLIFETPYGLHTKHLLYEGVVQETPKVSLSWEHDAFYWLPPHELTNQPLPDNADQYYKDAIGYLAQTS